MKNLIIVDHPLIKRDITILRDRRTKTPLFRATLRRISSLMAFEATSDIRLKRSVVRTPLESTTGYEVAERVVIVPVLRAGLGLVDGFLDFLPKAQIGHVGIYRDERTLAPVGYYAKLPKGLRRCLVLVLDPMLATGGSATAAISFLKKKRAERIRFVSLVAAPEGVRKLTRAHPDVKIFTAVLDRRLNDRGYILPGLGDAGDRTFGTQ
jgi:uracil phosphoribosyltransferase